jgi:gas vesicle protein
MTMSGQETQTHGYRFLVGLALGGAVGVGLALWLAPRAAAEIKKRAADSAKTLGDAVSDGYRDARTRVTDVADDLARKGQGLREGVFDTVVRAAHEVESGAKSVRQYAAGARKH